MDGGVILYSTSSVTRASEVSGETTMLLSQERQVWVDFLDQERRWARGRRNGELASVWRQARELCWAAANREGKRTLRPFWSFGYAIGGLRAKDAR